MRPDACHVLPFQTAASLLSRLQEARDGIYRNPTSEIPVDIKRLRQANFKSEYKNKKKQRDSS